VVLDRDALIQRGYNNPSDVRRAIPMMQGLGYDDSPHAAQNGAADIQRGTTPVIFVSASHCYTQ
jgi:iron complex outermembrane receptor protein